MAVRQIRDVLDISRVIHQHAVRSLTIHQTITDDYGLEGVLAVIQGIEQDVENMLDQVTATTRDQVLNTYVRYYPIDLEEQALEIVGSQMKRADSDPIKLLLEVKQNIIDILDSCMNNAVISDIHILLESVRDFEQSQLRDLSRKYVELAHEL